MLKSLTSEVKNTERVIYVDSNVNNLPSIIEKWVLTPLWLSDVICLLLDAFSQESFLNKSWFLLIGASPLL